MKYLLAALSFLLPAAVFAAPASTFVGDQSVFIASSSPGNAYVAGATVTVDAPTSGDLTAVGGSVTVISPILQDALLGGGAVSLNAPVSGSARLAGGSVSVTAPVTGDVVAVGAQVSDDGGGASVFIAAANATVSNGARGPVTIYANNVSLAGTFSSDVHVVASGRVSLAEGTVIHGSLSYQSPEQAVIPVSSQVEGGVHYSGANYLPIQNQARALVLAGFGVFLVVRVLAAIILAGLIAGLFPRFAEEASERAFAARPGSVLLIGLLGFGVLVATPLLLILLTLTFAGIGIAILALFAYALLLTLAFAFVGIFCGAFIARGLEHRDTIFWRDGALGMLIISIVALIPILGTALFFLVMVYALGTLWLLFFRFAFPKDSETASLL